MICLMLFGKIVQYLSSEPYFGQNVFDDPSSFFMPPKELRVAY